MSTAKAKDLRVQREEVVKYIREGMTEQGATDLQSLVATQCIYFWDSSDVKNLHRCINSELPEHVIASIVGHDYNGLSSKDKYFLPKSSQFSNAQLTTA